jgi:2-polyprenyl-3-methyl-5-hydroxy-6-metoxy-1,4-benzoquinol methylase
MFRPVLDRIERGLSGVRARREVPLKGQPMDGLAQFKQMQREGWRHFAPLELLTTPAAARLVRFAGVAAGMRVLDAGCGTGVVAITAARLGTLVKAIDLTPQLLERARENGAIAEVDIEWHEADVEELPFQDGEFDIVVSQFAHMFAPRPEVALREMLRVLRPGGTIAFSTWPPESLVGRTAQLHARYVPPPPGIPAPTLWGDPAVIRERFGTAVEDISFDRDALAAPALSPQHYRLNLERSVGPMIKLLQTLASDPERLRAFRREFDATVSDYRRDNMVRQDYLLTRARKI